MNKEELEIMFNQHRLECSFCFGTYKEIVPGIGVVIDGKILTDNREELPMGEK